jgi:hypothetical protein
VIVSVVAEIVMLERKVVPAKLQPMEQSACQVHAVLVVQNHQLKLTNNPFSMFIHVYIVPQFKSIYTGVGIIIGTHFCVVYFT